MKNATKVVQWEPRPVHAYEHSVYLGDCEDCDSLHISVLKIRVGSWSVIQSKKEHYYRLSLASPLEMYSKICPIKLNFARSHAEVGRKMTCNRPLF